MGYFFYVRREVVEKFPGKKFPDDYFMYGEDMEWCYLIKALGYKIVYNPAGVVIHYVSMSSMKDSKLDRPKLVRDNEFTFLARHYGSIHARIIFLLRSLNYITLVRSDRKFYQLAAQYFKTSFLGVRPNIL